MQPNSLPHDEVITEQDREEDDTKPPPRAERTSPVDSRKLRPEDVTADDQILAAIEPSGTASIRAAKEVAPYRNGPKQTAQQVPVSVERAPQPPQKPRA